MNLEEKWNSIVAGCEEGEAANNYEGPWAVMSGARGAAFAECMADLKAARTPRPPKEEWFGAPFDADGKPTGKWDAWWFEGSGVMRGCEVQKRRKGVYIDGISEDGNDVSILIVGDGPLSLTTECIPVRREGPPAMDVGWDVVGG